MKTPAKYTPYLLSASLVVVFLAMMAVTKIQANKASVTVSYEHEHGNRLNQPGPKVKRTVEENIEMGDPVFLKEDVNDEVVNNFDKLTVSNEEVSDEDQWMNKITKVESSTIKNGERFLVLAGSYTDNMRLLSKHAQYSNKGYDAAIIRFEGKKKKHICIGRFTQEKQAEAYANTVAEKLDISVRVHDKK